MIEAALAWLETSPPAEALAASRYVYPLVNAAHILGLATLFGSILALDLRLLGLWRSIPARPLAVALPRVAASGLALAAATGFLLFTVEPLDYAGNTAFLAKVSLVALGTLHAVSVHFGAAWKAFVRDGAAIGWRLRTSAVLSIALWTTAIIAGRLIAF